MIRGVGVGVKQRNLTRGQGQGWGPFPPLLASINFSPSSSRHATRTTNTLTLHPPARAATLQCAGCCAHRQCGVLLLSLRARWPPALPPRPDLLLAPLFLQLGSPRLSAAWPPSARPRGRDRAAGRRTVVGGMCLMSSAACSSIACASQPVAALGRASSSPSRTALW